MTVRRGFLYTGVFLVATGGVILAAQAGAVDAAAVTGALALWPLALIAIGVGLIVRRTRVGLSGGLIAAAMPGLLFGGMIVAVPDLPDLADLATACGPVANEAPASRYGTFGTAAVVDLSLACGELVVTTGSGTGWELDTAGGPNTGAVVTAAPDRLTIRPMQGTRPFRGSLGRGADWRLRLPAGPLLDLVAEINAGKATIDLSGARLGSVRLDVNAADAHLDLGGATVSRLAVRVNAGEASVRLPGGADLSADLDAELEVSAGSLSVCAPADLGLRIRGSGSLSSTTYNGLVRTGDAWESPNYATASHHADLTISASVASVVVNPEGGCL